MPATRSDAEHLGASAKWCWVARHRGSLGGIFELELTRRQILSGAAATGLGCVLTHAPRAWPMVAASSARGELTPQRRMTYEALVAAVVAEPPLRLDPAWAGIAAAQFADVYSTWSADARQRADRVLEALQRGPDELPFSAQPRGARARFLHGCARVSSKDPAAAEHGRLALLESALGLVAVAVGPAEDGGRGLVSI
jgi:hypothetical protein